MQIADSYISNIICHHYSPEKSEIVINNNAIDMCSMSQETLKDFFLKPFLKKKDEYVFSHAVSLEYNVVYNMAIKLFRNGDFVDCSKQIFRHLVSTSDNPTVKSGDVFVVKIENIEIANTSYEAMGIYKIDAKKEFIETSLSNDGDIKIEVKSGFATNKIDKASLVVFTETMPLVYVIEPNKDIKYWRNDFMGLIPKQNNYTNSGTTMRLVESFVKNELSRTVSERSNQIEIINKCNEILHSHENISFDEFSKGLFEDENLCNEFKKYRRIYEEQNSTQISNDFSVDKEALRIAPSIRRIKLDDTVEMQIFKTGNFLQRGYDELQKKYYYTIYFSKEG